MRISNPNNFEIPNLEFVTDNGFNPLWNESFELIVRNTEMALIRFEVHDEDIFGEKHLIGQAMYPVSVKLSSWIKQFLMFWQTFHRWNVCAPECAASLFATSTMRSWSWPLCWYKWVTAERITSKLQITSSNCQPPAAVFVFDSPDLCNPKFLATAHLSNRRVVWCMILTFLSQLPQIVCVVKCLVWCFMVCSNISIFIY